ncbi:SREBP regulating gene protein-like [Daphnia carinata]|uniref:SREBP regulating gene protein-like n=1 Tax=Daphnia carinata TaxID=120202 RepID=UPI00257D3830|nr:SREBP regulating gene protein-like [Daphnia carinata]
MLTAVVLRFLRSKLFLTAIFFASFTYFVVNFYNDNSTLLLSNEDVDVHELGSGRRPLGHIFQWQGAEDENDTNSKPVSCRNSVQGKALIADNKGYVCGRHNVMPNGCCKPETDGTKHYSCETCHNNGCCSIYEYCISCCLQPDKKEVLQDVLGKAAGTLNLLLTSVTDHFELCLTKCRTSSQSVQHENSYRNPRAKHCYGEAPPPLETEGTVDTS